MSYKYKKGGLVSSGFFRQSLQKADATKRGEGKDAELFRARFTEKVAHTVSSLPARFSALGEPPVRSIVAPSGLTANFALAEQCAVMYARGISLSGNSG